MKVMAPLRLVVLLVVFTLCVFCVAGFAARQQTADMDAFQIPFGRSIQVDGHPAAGEWDDAASLIVGVAPGWDVPVRVKHDGSNLLVAFSNLASPDGKSFRFPEVLIDIDGSGSAAWAADDWWFHASFRDCQSKGRPNDYSTCQKDAANWEANNYESTQRAPEVIELRIPFSTLGIEPRPNVRIGIAFDVTDTRSVWNFWPVKAEMNSPGTWRRARFGPAQKTGGV